MTNLLIEEHDKGDRAYRVMSRQLTSAEDKNLN